MGFVPRLTEINKGDKKNANNVIAIMTYILLFVFVIILFSGCAYRYCRHKDIDSKINLTRKVVNEMEEGNKDLRKLQKKIKLYFENFKENK